MFPEFLKILGSTFADHSLAFPSLNPECPLAMRRSASRLFGPVAKVLLLANQIKSNQVTFRFS